MKKLTNAMIRYHLITIGALFAAALTLALCAPASAQDYRDNGRSFTQNDPGYDYNYRERTGGSRSSRYSPRDQESPSGMDYDYNYGRAADDDYDWRYRERTGGSREGRYMPNGQRRGPEPGTYSRQGMGADDDYDWRYRERTGGSREQRYMPRGQERQGEQEGWSFFGEKQDRRDQMTRREYTGGSRNQRYSPRQESYERTQRDYDYQPARERTGGSRDQRYSPRRESYERTQRDYDYQPARERTGGSRDQRYSPRSTQRGERDFSRAYFDAGQARQATDPWKFDRVKGSIKEMNSVNLLGMDDPHSVARLKLDNGRIAKVDLGPRRKVEEYNIKKGDNITVFGSSGRINDRPMLMAHWIEYDNKVVSIRRPQDRNMRRYSAQVVKTKETNIRNSGNLLMARVKFEDGRTTIINLGPSDELKAYNVKPGTEISMLTRPVNIDGKRALVAEQLKIGDKVVDINWEKVKKLPKQ